MAVLPRDWPLLSLRSVKGVEEDGVNGEDGSLGISLEELNDFRDLGENRLDSVDIELELLLSSKLFVDGVDDWSGSLSLSEFWKYQ